MYVYLPALGFQGSHNIGTNRYLPRHYQKGSTKSNKILAIIAKNTNFTGNFNYVLTYRVKKLTMKPMKLM